MVATPTTFDPTFAFLQLLPVVPNYYCQVVAAYG